MRRLGAILLASAVSLLSAPPEAAARGFKVYGVQTPARGDLDGVYWADYVAAGGKDSADGLWRHTVEMDYSFSERWTIGVFGDFEDSKDGSLRYAQARFLVRTKVLDVSPSGAGLAFHAVYDFPENWYRSYEQVEVRMIFEQFFGIWNVRLNPIFEKKTSGPDVTDGLSFAYAAGAYRPVSPDVSAGLELHGGIGEIRDRDPTPKQRHYVVPTIRWKVNKRLSWEVGAAIGYTQEADDFTLKSLLEYRF